LAIASSRLTYGTTSILFVDSFTAAAHLTTHFFVTTNTFLQAPPQPYSPAIFFIAGIMQVIRPPELTWYGIERCSGCGLEV
jgi:hypothetical protein